MAFHFFTEPNKLQDQSANQAFGAIDENNYRLNNIFSATSNPKAFAITSGSILIQPIDSNTITLVLKPEEQPNLDLPKIDYIIYKGLQKTSLINGNQVAESTNNDLTRKIWESHADLIAEIPNSPTEPLANDALGFGYSSSGADSYEALDTDSLNKAFFDDDNRLFRVESGDYIGDFNASQFGVMIVLEKIGYTPTFQLAREMESMLSFSSLDPSSTEAEIFRRKHDKEDVLAFLDSTAFFSAFDGTDIKVFDGADFIEQTPEEFYNEVTEKHLNKNALYLDLRNETLDSYNYYDNYSNSLKLDLIGDETFLDIDYYRNQWPLLILDDSEFDTNNTEKNIGFLFSKGDNEFPCAFLKRGMIAGIDNLQDNPNARFMDLDNDSEEYGYKLQDTLYVPKNDLGVIKSNYFQLRYIKRYATPDSIYLGLSLKKESYLDNLFPIFNMELPFLQEGSVNIKMFADGNYVDKSNINVNEFIVNLGIAKDNNAINFVAIPSYYNSEELNDNNKIPLNTKQVFNGDTFIDDFNKTLGNYVIEKRTFELPQSEINYYSFGLDEAYEAPVIEPDISYDNPPIQGDYDVENTNIITLTLEQFQSLKTISEQEFSAPYKVYLGIANTNFLTESEDSIATTVFCLRGLKEDEDGLMTTNEYITDLEVFAEQDLYNWEDTSPNHTDLNHEEKFHLLTELNGFEYDKEQEFGNNQSTFEYLYEVLGVALKNTVDAFSSEINLLTDVNFKDNIEDIILEKGKQLLNTARQDVRTTGNSMYGKDGALYIARLQMRRLLKDHPEAKNVSEAFFESCLNTLEKITRGLHKNNLPDFSTHPNHIPIIICGYDPFRSSNLSEGLDHDFHLSNPSGNLALALDGVEIVNGSKQAIVKSTIFPVRFKEFNEGWIEDFLDPYINTNNSEFDTNIALGNQVKMIITFSHGLTNSEGTLYYKVDRFAARNRKPNLTDNNGKLGKSSEYLKDEDKDLFEFIETNLQYVDMYIEHEVDLHQRFNFNFYNGNNFVENKDKNQTQISSLIPFPSLSNYSPNSGQPADSIKSVWGSGGSYLSNEIFYRVAFLRKKYEGINPDIKTGHIHMGFLRNDTTSDRTIMVNVIKQALEAAIISL